MQQRYIFFLLTMFWMTGDQVHQKREDPNTNPLSQIQNYWLYPNLQSECILESLFFFPFIEFIDRCSKYPDTGYSCNSDHLFKKVLISCIPRRTCSTKRMTTPMGIRSKSLTSPMTRTTTLQRPRRQAGARASVSRWSGSTRRRVSWSTSCCVPIPTSAQPRKSHR